MNNRSLNDDTQLALIPHIQDTQRLMEMAISILNSGNGNAEITIMPDLGVSSNPVRMKGGFFTGMFVWWDSPSIPFITIDTTVNGCGVSVYTLNDTLSSIEFFERVNCAKKYFSQYSYSWNFERGNHFISYGITEEGVPCAVFHASVDEYKRSVGDCSLYPDNNIWYADDIRTVKLDNGRYLRFITGSFAERFSKIATELPQKNDQRMDIAAELIFGKYLKEKCFYVPHYGMPDEHCVAIGCSWYKNQYALLTARGKNIYLIRPQRSSDNQKYILNPHGFGVQLSTPCKVDYQNNQTLSLNAIPITNQTQILTTDIQQIRGIQMQDFEIKRHVDKILQICPGTVYDVIHQIASVSSVGTDVFHRYSKIENGG